MKQVTTYVGIDAHKNDLFVAMLMGTHAAPVTWTVPNEPKAVRRRHQSSPVAQAPGVDSSSS